MARSVLMLITVNELGRITVDVRGPLKDDEDDDKKKAILEILKAATELVEQGDFRHK